MVANRALAATSSEKAAVSPQRARTTAPFYVCVSWGVSTCKIFFRDWTEHLLGDTLRIPALCAIIGAILVSAWLWPKFNS
jgi:hypothetical protein